MSRHVFRRLVACVAMLASVAAGCGDDGAAGSTPGSSAGATDEMGEILEVAAAEGDLDSFLAATEAAGVMDGLHGDGPFTVFDPG